MKIIIANWKSNKNLKTAESWLDDFLKNNFKNNNIIIAPSFVLLNLVFDKIKNFKNINLATQDLSPFPAGKYTGAVCAQNLQGFDVQYAIVGHSERRRYFHETDQEVANKISECINNNITPILCLDQKYIASQANAINKKFYDKLIIAYEPLSAIGSGHEASPKHVQEIILEIKNYYGQQAKIIYGGSVDAENIKSYLNICDGVLVGTASLEVESFWGLLRAS